MVVVTDIDRTKADAVAAEIKEAGGKAISYPGDVTDPAFPAGIVAATVAAFGKINHIVNNGAVSDALIKRHPRLTLFIVFQLASPSTRCCTR